MDLTNAQKRLITKPMRIVKSSSKIEEFDAFLSNFIFGIYVYHS